MTDDPANPSSDTLRVHVLRVAMGALAGLTSCICKYWSHDHSQVQVLFRDHRWDAVVDFFLGYSIGLLCLMFLGAITAWISREYDFRKMFWIGLSAPSLLAAAIPPLPAPPNATASKTGWIEYLSPVSSAYAADNYRDCVGDDYFAKGFKTFFGIRGTRSDKFTVIVASYTDQQAAQAKVAQINKEDPALKARVGKRACTSEYYPVIVGEALIPQDDAKGILARALKLDSVPADAYVSPGPR